MEYSLAMKRNGALTYATTWINKHAATEGHISYDSTYMKYPELITLQRQNSGNDSGWREGGTGAPVQEVWGFTSE